MKKISLTLGIFFAVCLLAMPLSPPQYGYWREITGSIGASPHVQVKEIVVENGVNVIEIVGADADVCKGLAYILPSQQNFGGIKVALRIVDKSGNPYTSQILKAGDDATSILKNHLQNALRDNPYFSRMMESEGFMGKTLWLEFEPAVIQFFNDNIGDYYGNNNYVAAEVFPMVIKSVFGVADGGTALEGMSVNISYTTAPVKKESQAGFFRLYP